VISFRVGGDFMDFIHANVIFHPMKASMSRSA
jgi:hypothetical protein